MAQDLDSAIKKLMESGASDEDITFFIQNYKSPETKPLTPSTQTPAKSTAIQAEPEKEPFFTFPFAGKVREIAQNNRQISPMDMFTPTVESPGLRGYLEDLDMIPSEALPYKGLEKVLSNLLLSTAEGATSPAGISTAIMGGFPQTRSLAKRGLEKIFPGLARGAEEVIPEALPQIAKPRLRLNPDRTYTNLDTGEVFDFAGAGIPESPIKINTDPNYTGGMGDAELAGSIPYGRAEGMYTPEAQKRQMLELLKEGMPTTKEGMERRLTKGRSPTGVERRIARIESELTAPTGAGVPKFKSTTELIPEEKLAKQKRASERFGQTQQGIESQVNEFDPSTLVGMARETPTPPSQPPKFRIKPGGEITDNQTGERLGSLVAKSKDQPVGFKTELANLPRAIQSSYDISFPFRQGLGLIHTKGWWSSWDDMFKALGSDKSYKAVMDSILEKPNYIKSKLPDGRILKSFAEEAGLDITDLINHREEQMISKIAEKIPGIKASNRAYTAFANKLRSDVFDNLITQAEKQGLNPKKNLVLAKEIAQFVNNASGRGSLGSLEKNASQLAAALFSPKLIASRVQMLNQILNPFTYRTMNPYTKKQYWKSMFAMASTWTTIASLAKMGGADVSLDPDSADFGKIKIGDTRLDPGGGFQQYLVLAHRMASGKYTSSTSGKESEYGSSFGGKARIDAITDFVQNKLAPIPATAAGALGATRYRPFEVGDESIRLVTPMIIQDILEVLQEDPNLLPITGLTAVGMGTQTYGERGRSIRVMPESIFPRESDIRFKGGSFFD